MADNKTLQMILDRVAALDKKTEKGFKGVNKEIDGVEKRLTKRIDRLGMDLAHLSGDAPTVEELNELDKRVGKLEHQFTTL